MSRLQTGVVVAVRGRRFVVRTPNSAGIECVVRQKVKDIARQCTPVAVGDDVTLSLGRDGGGCIEEVMPRRSSFSRPSKGSEKEKQIIAANLDLLAVVASVASPPLKTGLIDRFLIAAKTGDLEPVVIFNKSDLLGPADLPDIIETYQTIGIPAFLVSALSGDGIEGLAEHLASHRTLFAGHSGVGKSTLLNRLVPGLDLKTREISEFSNRGKHTTSTIELYELPEGGMVIDSPGLKIMGLWSVEKEELKQYFTEFEQFDTDCRFSGCSHSHEPDCGVKKAVENGCISRFRYRNYLAILDSL